MASSKLTALSDLAIPALTDEMYIVRPSDGAAGSRSVTLTNLRAFLLGGVRDNIEVNMSTVGNVDAGPDVLHTFTLGAGSLAANEDYLWLRYAGAFAANANTKTLIILFGGQTVSNLAQIQNGGAWVYDIIYTRVSDTTVRCASQISWGRLRRPSGGALTDDGLLTGEVALITVADLDTTAMILEVQGGNAGSATDDTVQNLSIIELVKN